MNPHNPGPAKVQAYANRNGIAPQLTQEEARALEVAQCARHAVMDAATMCARAGLIGTAIQQDLQDAHAAMCRVIDTIQEAN